ncbi:MAG: helix-turn-helix domain-containing protein [Hyphomonadaceae bacterium]
MPAFPFQFDKERAFIRAVGEAMPKMLKNGRTKVKDRFVMLTYDILNSPAWEGLSAQARAVLIQIAKRYNGGNNGALAASVRNLAAECRINKDTAAKAVKELLDAGFLELAQAGAFSFKKRHAAEYRLTWLKCDQTGARGSRAWKTKDATQDQLSDFHRLGGRNVAQ